MSLSFPTLSANRASGKLLSYSRQRLAYFLRRAPLVLLTAILSLPVEAYVPQWIDRQNIPALETNDVLAADFNSDDVPDVLTWTASNTLELSLTVSHALTTQTRIATSVSHPAILDGDGDHKPDIVAIDESMGNVLFFRGLGNGTFAAPVVNTMPFRVFRAEPGDFDEDGTADLFVQSGTTIGVFVGNGTGSFTEVTRMSPGLEVYDAAVGDVDGDGSADVVLANFTPRVLYVYFGNGDATFSPPVTLTGSPVAALEIGVADLDHDDDLEILTCDQPSNAVTVFSNLGNRSFAPAAAINAFDPPITQPNAVDFTVADVTDDGAPDLIVTLTNKKTIATLENRGDGTFEKPVYSYVYPEAPPWQPAFPRRLVAADLTGDGRPDLVVSTGSDSRLVRLVNATGDSTLGLLARYPTISLGQTARFSINATPWDFNEWPGGQVLLKEAGSVLGSATIVDGTATIEVAALELGDHQLEAFFEGNTRFRPTTSSAITQHVVPEATTVAIQAGAGPIAHGDPYDVQASATSAIGGALTGEYRLFVNEQPYGLTQHPSWGRVVLPAGTPALYVAYEGDNTHPPGRSETIHVAVSKGESTTEITNLTPRAVAGTSIHLNTRVEGRGSSPSGTVTFLKEGIAVATQPLGSGTYLDLSSYPAGNHFFKVRYSGDGNYEPSESAVYQFTILPAGPLGIDAAISQNGFIIHATEVGSASQYRIFRKVGSDGWMAFSNPKTFPVWFDANPSPNTVYAYRVEAFNANDQLIATSNVDTVTLTTFIDDPLDPSTPIKAQHVLELLAATNVLRAAAGLPSTSLANVQPGKPILASHLIGLRTAINEARAILGAPAIEALPPVESGGPIKLGHVQSLRDAFR